MKEETFSLVDHVDRVSKIRHMNDEYDRGFREGQHEAAREFAEIVDRLLRRYDHVAIAGKVVFNQPGD